METKRASIEIVLVVACFHFVNRIAAGLGVVLESSLEPGT